MLKKDSVKLLKQKEIFDGIFHESRFEINILSEGIDFNNLAYHYKDKSAPKYVIHCKGPLVIYNDIKNGRISLQEEEKFHKNLN